jgi:transcriptional regulator with XRE-family HTH domain
MAPLMEALVLKPWTPSRKPIARPAWTLRDLTVARSLSLSELAVLAGIDRSMVTRALRGERPVSARVRRAISRTLAIEPDMVRWELPDPRQQEAN